jgi:hypothetical protein
MVTTKADEILFCLDEEICDPLMKVLKLINKASIAIYQGITWWP